MAILGESQQQTFDDVEVRVFTNYDGSYTAEVRLPDGARFSSPLPAPDSAALNQELDPRAHGTHLFEWLFQGEVGAAYRRVQRLAEGPYRDVRSRGGIRLRLWLDPKSSELRRLHWESLHDPERDEPLSVNTAFSRFLRSSAPRGWPIWERPLRMLLVVSNPAGLDRFDLSEIDVEVEKMILREATRPWGGFVELHRLSGVPSLAEIEASVGRGYHIVHLLAHTRVHAETGRLILADDMGHVQEVACEAVAGAIVRPSGVAPYLVFLATPSTAEEYDADTLVSLAPLLIEAGVQAVVAIQAPIGRAGLRRFTERFYDVLIRTGIIDVAVADARAELYEAGRWEWTYPVLYMRTPDAQLFQPLPEELESKVQGPIWKY